MAGFLLRSLALCLLMILAHCQPDISGCDVCDEQYSEWLRNRTSSDYWEMYPSPSAAGDRICEWAEEIYTECYSTCAIDPYGNIAPHYSRSAMMLSKFNQEQCLAGECRLADTQSCAYLPQRRSRCDPRKLDCVTAMRDACGSDQLSTPAERRAYGQSIVDELNCYLSYPDNKIANITVTPEEERGLQHCKDIIIVECLRSWSDEEYDLIHLTSFSNLTEETFCGEKEEALQCLYATSQSNVTYARYSYETPCQLDLLQHPEVISNTYAKVEHIYASLCENSSEQLQFTEAIDETTPSHNHDDDTTTSSHSHDDETTSSHSHDDDEETTSNHHHDDDVVPHTHDHQEEDDQLTDKDDMEKENSGAAVYIRWSMLLVGVMVPVLAHG